MSFGKMNTPVRLFHLQLVKDGEGFTQEEESLLASVRAYREQRHGSEVWKNRASFTTATAMFRFRRIPGVEVKPGMLITCDTGRYRIVSLEDIKGRGMYLEALCEKVATESSARMGAPSERSEGGDEVVCPDGDTI